MDQRRLDRLLGRLHAIDDGTSVLRRICSVAADVTSTAGAGVSRMVGGRPEALEATAGLAVSIETLQVALSEGPCVDTFESLKPSLEPDVASPAARARWPRFAPAALEHGVVAAYAFPLMSAGMAIGALDVYSTRTGELGKDQVADALVLAGLAGLAVERHDTETSISGVDLIAEPAEEWAHPAVVHNASGIVSEQLDIAVDEALLRLRAAAFVTGRRVADVARDVVERRMRIEAWVDDV